MCYLFDSIINNKHIISRNANSCFKINCKRSRNVEIGNWKLEIWPSCFCTIDERIQFGAEFFNYCFVFCRFVNIQLVNSFHLSQISTFQFQAVNGYNKLYFVQGLMEVWESKDQQIHTNPNYLLLLRIKSTAF